MLSNPSLGKISVTLQYSSQSDKYLPGTKSKILIPVGAGLSARPRLEIMWWYITVCNGEQGQYYRSRR